MSLNPLVILTFCFCLGIIIAGIIQLPVFASLFFAATFFSLCIIWFRKAIIFDLALMLLVLFLGAACLSNSKVLPANHISRLGFYNNKENPYKVKGFICSQPQTRYNKTIFSFRTKEIEFSCFKQNALGDMLVYADTIQTLNYGDELILRGSLSRPFKKYSGQDVYVIMRANCVTKLKQSGGWLVKRFALRLKQEIENIIFSHTSRLSAGVIDAMLLGEKNYIPPLLYKSMMKTGTVHILVVSGFNVGIVGFIIFLILKFLRFSRRWRLGLAIPCLIIYCLMTGSSPPVVRATVMAMFFIFNFLIKREPDMYNSLSLAAIFILSIAPGELFNISFQLSFASVFSIVFLYPKMRSFLHVQGIKQKLLGWVVDGFLVSLSAWLGTAGIIGYYFQQFSPIAVIANVFIVPLATLISLSALGLILISQILPILTPFFASSCELLVSLLLITNAFFAKI